jgi:hypothetical protein
MLIFIPEFDTLKLKQAGDGSEAIVYQAGADYVIKSYRRGLLNEKIIRNIKITMALNHPYINTPIDYKVVENKNIEGGEYIEVLYKRMYDIRDNEFVDIISMLDKGIRGFNNKLMKSIGEEITRKGWEVHKANIWGVIDAYNAILGYATSTTALDIHEGNIMQDKKGLWKIIDF